MAPARFGRFELLERLGTGGAGEVLLVADGARRAALKRLLPHLEDAETAAAFDREAALAARLEHDNIVRVLEHGRVDGSRYVLMEYVDGKSLQQLLRACGRLTAGAAAFATQKVCHALAYAHALCDGEGRPLELIHRDVSPSNVLVSRRGEVKLCDFGIARLGTTTATRTQPGFIKGKRGYLSPEQQARETLDARSDLYAAGVVLFEALTGQRPRGPGDRPSRLMPEVLPALDRICARALAVARDERFGTAHEMAAALGSVVATTDGEAQLARYMEQWCPPRAAGESDPTHTLARFDRRRGWLIVAVAVGVVAVTLLAFARRRAPSAPAETRVVPAKLQTAPPAGAVSPSVSSTPRGPTSAQLPARHKQGADRKPPPRSRQPIDSDYMPDPFRR
jgi:eukaryotic-like serine/threonine-protein kinase